MLRILYMETPRPRELTAWVEHVTNQILATSH